LAWNFSKKRLAQFAVLAVMAGEFSSAAADVLILRSVGPSARNYPPGRRVPDSASFTLRPGDSVVVLAGGGTRTFRGPGTFSAAGPARAGLAGQSQVRRNTGAVRGSGDTAVLRPSDVWQVDVTQTGRACVPAGRRPVLWRPVADRAVRLTITPQTGAAQTVNWNQGQATLAWPASVPIVDGASYQLSWPGAAAPTRLTTRTLTGLSVDNVDAVASALVANQCGGQLDVLIATREARDASPAPARGGSVGGSGNR
jgi:hypothetical protein